MTIHSLVVVSHYYLSLKGEFNSFTVLYHIGILHFVCLFSDLHKRNCLFRKMYILELHFQNLLVINLEKEERQV
ncbi:hypothetical protein XENTR_v10024092 [Xenopus tropicalis]|nr:hypothetical protein XENTR_v10024092 [Xenopus tropicalis]